MTTELRERITPIVERLTAELVEVARGMVREQLLAVLDDQPSEPPPASPKKTRKPPAAKPDKPKGQHACGKCGLPGHNARSCGSQVGAPDEEDEEVAPKPAKSDRFSRIEALAAKRRAGA